MEDHSESFAHLSPNKRRLLELLLRERQQSAAAETGIPRSEAPGPHPLSFAQQRLWFLDQLEPESSAYNIAAALRMAGPLALPALKQSLHEVVRRHEILRTTFTSVDGQPVQEIAPRLDLGLTVVDLQRLPAHQRDAATQQVIYNEVHHRFTLSQVPLLRTTLIRLGPQEHIFVLTIHHIIADGWSNSILIRELADLYSAMSERKPAALPALLIRYRDFARWQRQWLDSDVLAAQLAYWRRQLDGAPGLLELPTDRPRPKVQSFAGGKQWISFSLPVSEGLRDLSRQAGATLFVTMLAAFQVLLSRYSEQTDLLVGVPIAGRHHPNTEQLIGLFANTLVIRADLSGNPTFREVLARIQRTASDAYTHQDMPFEYLVKELQPERNLGYNPVVQVLCSHMNAPMPLDFDRSLRLSFLDVPRKTAIFDLSLMFWETPTILEGFFEYSTDLFNPDTISRMAGHFQTLLEGIIAAPGQRIGRLPLLTAEEERRLVVDWNGAPAPVLEDDCIHSYVEAQVERTPAATALISATERLNYDDLNRRANQLAHYLRAHGVGPEVRVGLCLKRSADLIVGMLGILKAGGAYVPLDPAYPAERLQYMLEDAKVAVLLTSKEIGDRRLEIDAAQQSPISDLQSPVIFLDADWPTIAQQPEANLDSGVRPGNLAYVMYTSGSTGRPKGVAVSHQGVVALLHWASAIYSPEQLAGVLATTSVCFDLSVFEVFVPLSWGGSVLLAENALQLPQLPADSSVTLINTVPSAIAELLRVGGIPASVATINLGGEALPATLPEQLYRLGSVQQVMNLYGPTEDTVYSTYALIEPGADGTPTIGRPLAGTAVYVLDREFQPVPIGVAGELYIGGIGLARGYLHRPDLTAERFVPNPFTTTDDRRPTMSNGTDLSGGRWSVVGGRLYRTGDRVRYRADGQLDFLGRVDAQIKLRGYRIELGEIEAALNRHPSVSACAVVVRELPSGDRGLVAYVVSAQEQRTKNKEQKSEKEDSQFSGELRAFLKRTLPEYMLPAACVILDALPLTPNGKVDRRALPAVEDQPGSGATPVGPRTPAEELLAGIWEQVLSCGPVSVYDNFFELGGHSLLTTQVLSRVRDTFQVELPLRIFFEAGTLADQAAQIADAQQTQSGVPAPPIVALPRNPDEGRGDGGPSAGSGRGLALSFAQQRLWFFEQLEPEIPVYTIPATLRLRGRLDVPALRQTIGALVARHEFVAYDLHDRRRSAGPDHNHSGRCPADHTRPYNDSRSTSGGRRRAHHSRRAAAAL